MSVAEVRNCTNLAGIVGLRFGCDFGEKAQGSLQLVANAVRWGSLRPLSRRICEGLVGQHSESCLAVLIKAVIQDGSTAPPPGDEPIIFTGPTEYDETDRSYPSKQQA